MDFAQFQKLVADGVEALDSKYPTDPEKRRQAVARFLELAKLEEEPWEESAERFRQDMRLGRLGVAQPASPQPLNLQQGGTDGSSSSSLLRGTAAAGGSAPQMGGLGSQPGRGAHMQAISGVAAGLGSAPATDLSRSHGRSVQETSWRLQALTEDNSRAIAQGVRESTASAAAMGASASTAHSTRAPGADIGSGQANRLMPQDELSLQVLEQMSQRVNFSRDGSPRRVVRYSQHATGHSTDGDIAPAGGRPGAAAEHQLLLRQQQQQQQQQQARAWPPAAAPRLAHMGAGTGFAASAHDPLVALRSLQRPDADTELGQGAPQSKGHAWGQQQRQLPPRDMDPRPEAAAGSLREALAQRAAQAAAHARSSSMPAPQSWPLKRANGSGLGSDMGLRSSQFADDAGQTAFGDSSARAGASAAREQPADIDSDVEEVPPPQRAARAVGSHGEGSSRLQPAAWAEAPSRNLASEHAEIVTARQAASPSQQPMLNQSQQQQSKQELTMIQHQQAKRRQQQQQLYQQHPHQQQLLSQQQASTDAGQLGPDRSRGNLDRTPPRKLQATQRVMPLTAPPDSASQQRPQALASAKWTGQPTKPPVILPGRGPVVAARPDQPRVVTTRLPQQARVMSGSGRTPPPVIRPGPGLAGPSGGPGRGGAAAAVAASTVPHAMSQQPQSTSAAASRAAASVLPPDSVVLRDVEVLLTAIGGLMTRAPAYGVVSITALLGLHAKLCVRRGVPLSPWVLGQSRTLAATQAAARSRGTNASALAACDTKLLLLLDMGSGGLGSEASRPPLLQQQTGSGRRGAGGRAGSVLDTSQLGSWFVVHWWPDKGGDEVLQGVGGTSPNGPGGRPQLESLHTFAARFLPQGVTGRAAAEDTAEAEQAVLELINVLPYPDASGIKGLEELRAVLTSGSVQEHELLPLVQWWQGGLGPCSALGAAHGAAAEHQRQYHEQHQQALGAGNTQQDPANSGAFASLLLLAKAAMEPQPGNGVLQEQSVSATAAAIGQEGEMQPLCEREAAPAAEEGGHEDGARDMDAAVPPSQAMSPVG